MAALRYPLSEHVGLPYTEYIPKIFLVKNLALPGQRLRQFRKF
jgi:hypothetical protein